MMILQQTRGVLSSWLDADARTYITGVEAADAQPLETGVKVAINNFVKGCKNDGIWGSIKTSCILAGARTLSGALVPLRGIAPTNFNFVSGDYDRKTGLVGNSSTKYLNSNRNNNTDPQNSKSISIWTTVSGSVSGVSLGSGGGDTGATTIGSLSGSTRNNCSVAALGGLSGYTGFYGASRSASTGYTRRVNSTNFPVFQASQTPYNGNLFVLNNNGAASFSDNRLSFYHIGESLDLAALDSRVSTLMTNLTAAIP